MKNLNKYHEPGRRQRVEKIKVFIVAFVSLCWIGLVALDATGVIKNKDQRFYSHLRHESMHIENVPPMTAIAFHDGIN